MFKYKFLILFLFISVFNQAQKYFEEFDKNTGEKVVYNQVSDSKKIDGILVKKIAGFIYQRVIPNNIINVKWFGNNSDAIQKAIDFATIENGIINSAQYSVFLPQGNYFIDKKIIIKNTEGLHLYGGGFGTVLAIAPKVHLKSIFELNGVAYTLLENLTFAGGEDSSCDSFIWMYWGDMVNSRQVSSNPQRSNLQNNFYNIRNVSGRFKNAVVIDGQNQNDTSSWYNCSFNGLWNPSEKEYYNSAFFIGNGATANNLIHNFTNNYHTGLKNAYVFAGSGGSISGGGASNMGTFIRRIGVNETLLVESVRLEGTQMIYTTDGPLKGIHEAADNITFQNLYYSGTGSDKKYFQFPEDGILIFHGGGTMNIIGSTIHQLPKGKIVRFKLSGAQNENFHNNFNIIGSNIETDYNNLFLYDTWVKASVSVTGSNESKGSSMGRHIKNWEKDINYNSKNKN